MHHQVERLLKAPQFIQRTAEWYVAREQRLTASDIAAALNIPPYETYSGSPRNDLLNKKKNPESNKFFGNEYTEWGVKHEPEAIKLYEKMTNSKVLDFGLMIHPTIDWLGASPDGITEEGVCIEVKAPLSRQIEPGVIPKHYLPQVQCQLQVLGLNVAHFVQYRPSELTWPKPPVLDVTVVEKDDDWWDENLPKLIKFREDLENWQQPPIKPKRSRRVSSSESPKICHIKEYDLTEWQWHE